MDCNECKSEICRFVSGDMDGARQSELLSHVAHCDGCREALKDLIASSREDRPLHPEKPSPRRISGKVWVILALAAAFAAVIAAMKIRSEIPAVRTGRFAPVSQNAYQPPAAVDAPGGSGGPMSVDERARLVDRLGAGGRCNEAMLHTMLLERDGAEPAVLKRAFMANADCRARAGELEYAAAAYRNIASRFPDLAGEAAGKLKKTEQSKDGG